MAIVVIVIWKRGSDGAASFVTPLGNLPEEI